MPHGFPIVVEGTGHLHLEMAAGYSYRRASMGSNRAAFRAG